MSFQKLLDELEALSAGKTADDVTKSMGTEDEGDDNAADDTKIAEAAADGEAAGESEDGKDDDGSNDDGEQLGKSFRFQTEDGEEVEALDATDLLKSLVAKVDSNESQMGRAVSILTDLVKSQATEIGGLRSEVSRLASLGRGRKTMVTVAEKPDAGDLNKSDPADEGIPASDFMAKCLTAQSAGKITSLDVARAESYINRRLDVPADIKAKVLA